MKLPTLFKNKERKTSWKLWPPCKNLKTLSFQYRDSMPNNLDSENITITESSCFTMSPKSSCAALGSDCGGESLKMVWQALKSERLSFKPEDANSIFAAARLPFKECLVLAMESKDPYMDFWVSMGQMIEAYGCKASGLMDWECLEEMLAWYLRMNKKKNHGYIIGAFVDLCVRLSSSSFSNSSSYSSSSSLSFSASISSSKLVGKEVEEDTTYSCP